MRKTCCRAAAALLLCTPVFFASAQDSLQDSLDSYFQHRLESSLLTGAVVMVTDGERIRYQRSFGKQNVAEDIDMEIDSIFRIASMTKPITSVAVMMLMEEGRLSLDDPITSHLPEYGNRRVATGFDADSGEPITRPATTDITIRHLLSHTAGMSYGFINDLDVRLASTGAYRDLEQAPLIAEPGSRFVYGPATRVLGYLVEEISGQSLDAFMAERIFAPLGMSETFYVVPTALHDRVVTVQQFSNDTVQELVNPDQISSTDRGDGGLHSTAPDYIRFIQMFLNGGVAADGTRLLSQASVELMHQNHIGELKVQIQNGAFPGGEVRQFPRGAGRDYFGLGFQVTAEHDETGVRPPGTYNWDGVFNTEFWIDPVNGIGALLMTQIQPFYHPVFVDTLDGFERLIYSQ